MPKAKNEATAHTSLEAAAAPVAIQGAPIEPPTIVFAADGCVMAHWCGVSIVVWAARATLPLVDELTRLADLVGRKYPRGSSVHLVVNGAGPPTREARAALRGLTNRIESRHICTAVWIEGGGFWASVIRSLVTSLDLVTGRRLKLSAFADLDALGEWVITNHAASLGLQLTPAEFVRVLAWLCAQPAVSKQRAARSED